MCGIIGFNWENKSLLRKMADSIIHRGPDDAAYFVGGGISLGMRRLSIIDLKKGIYPMANEKKDIFLIFNGEIYNFQEIRDALAKKNHTFRTHCDAEVIVHAYEEYGSDFLKLLNGMYAICIYDSRKKILFFARDRIGIKPLYYYCKDGRFIFASEIKAILQHNIAASLEPKALVDYLAFQNIMDEKTFFKDIYILLPGKYLIYNLKEKKMTISTYWDADFSKARKNKTQDMRNYLTSFRKTFRDSVERHMISNVPLGSYVSGGFDSSSITAIASEILQAKDETARLKTFTGKFREKGCYDETPCTRVLTEKYHNKRYEVTVTPKDFLDKIEEFVYHLDEPKAGLSAITGYCVARASAQHVRVVLMGHGGDELFAGYPVYKSAYLRSLVRRNPLNIFKGLGMFKPSEMPRAAYYLFFPLFQKETKYGFFIVFNSIQRKKLFHPEFYRQIEKYDPVAVVKQFYDGVQDDTEGLQKLYLKAYLPSMLVVDDKVNMAHSIEGRVPFCDNALVDFSLSTPLSAKLYNNTLKYIVKEAMKDKLPEIFYHQPKRGFPTPLSLWLRKELKQYSYDLLLSERAKSRKIFNPAYVKKLLDTHCKRKTDGLLDLVNAARIWCLINLEIWFRIFIDQDKKLLKEVRKAR